MDRKDTFDRGPGLLMYHAFRSFFALVHQELFEFDRVHVERDRFNIHEERNALRVVYGARGGEEGERTGDHAVARLQVHRFEGKEYSIGTGSTANGLRRSQEPGAFFFQFRAVLSEDEMLVFKNLGDGRRYFIPDLLILPFQIEHRYGHGQLLFKLGFIPYFHGFCKGWVGFFSLDFQQGFHAVRSASDQVHLNARVC